MHYRPAKAIIDYPALTHNIKQVKNIASKSKIFAVIKANGYGHGLIAVAKQLSSADGFGVASMEDAIELRQNGFLHPIILLEGIFSKNELNLVLSNRLDIVIHSHHQLEWLLNMESDQVLNIWIKIDTGMHRLGFSVNDLGDVLAQLKASHNPFNLHLMSHFSVADCTTDSAKDFTDHQLTTLIQSNSEGLPSSFANSAAIVNYPKSHLDWVRPGIMLYGSGFDQMTLKKLNLKPVMRLESQIQSLRWIPKGDCVGYGNRWQAQQESLIAVIAIGYGDGYPRHAKDGTPVLIANTLVPVAGTVSMDMITVDVTKIAHKVKIGQTAILWGTTELTVDMVASHANTIGYELLCGVTQRVPRIKKT